MNVLAFFFRMPKAHKLTHVFLQNCIHTYSSLSCFSAQTVKMASEFVRVAVVGCGHGALDAMYDAVRAVNAAAADGRPVDLLICCGDFQAVRNESDLECMACPPKYRSMQTFWRYYAGVAKAPVPEIELVKLT